MEDQIGRIVGQVAPSMLLTGISESVAFFLGAVIDMPAVRIFSMYAAMAVLIDFLLQVSASAHIVWQYAEFAGLFDSLLLVFYGWDRREIPNLRYV